MKKLLLLASVGWTAVAAGTVVTVVEEHNFERQHVINVVETYLINGEYVTEEDYLAFLAGTQTTSLYYGAVDNIEDFTLADLNQVNLLEGNTYTFHVDAGNPETEEGQYVTVALPQEYTLVSFMGAQNLQPYSFEETSVNDLNVYYLTTPVYNEDDGGENYKISFVK